ncbi:hypothetical protein FGO68_gene12827 [Halteria grandinella]|uniref:Uncharacterized protein n=1 Tax=Halteria grandinella TaxID=5974 RepID=A0A8J8NQF0_HALGN|nr:hypothetical protein FGO68_gene12827 [Halteria grandinella]
MESQEQYEEQLPTEPFVKANCPFALTQDDTYLYIRIDDVSRYLNEAEQGPEFHVDGNHFIFDLQPSHCLELLLAETSLLNMLGENNRVIYNREKGCYTCRVEKVEKGRVFAEIEGIRRVESEREMVHGEDEVYREMDERHQKEEQEELSKAKAIYKAAVESNKNGYGFMNQYIDVFKGQDKLLNECCTVNPFEVEINQRMRVKFVNEEEEFDPERYAFDNYDDEQLQEIEPILSLKAPLTQGIEHQFEAMSIQQEPQPIQDTVLNQQILIQILDVLYAYHYELRMHSFHPDPHSESASNITKLSSVLSSFVDYHELSHPPQLLLALLVNCTRRALLKPLYRNFELSQKVIDDMVEMTLNAAQPRKVMKQRLEHVREIMEGGEHRLYNVCYIDDMIKWMQGNYSDGEIRLVSQQLMNARGKVTKKHIGFELEEVDMMAQEYKKSGGME